MRGDKAGTYTLTVSKTGSTTVNDSVVITQEKGCTTESDPVANYSVSYIATTGGTLTGTAAQTVKKGQSASTVTAVANSGYSFVGWSDGKATASRTDTNITSNQTFRATFSKNPSEPTEDKAEDKNSAGSFPISLLMLGLLAFIRRNS
jgi:uncharacterized repeat protein (TIGR02543 family)